VADTFREVSSQSWFGRLGQSIKSVLVGLVIFVVSFPLIYWNESRSVRTARSLEEGAGAVVNVGTDRVDPTRENKLVHVSGDVTTPATLTDPDFGVSVKALSLIRHVEMFQWIETEKKEERKKLGGGSETVTTWDYKKDWSTEAVDSSSFKHPEGHQNPGELSVEAQTWTAEPINLGAFTLSTPVIEKLGGQQDLPVTGEQASQIAADDPDKVHVAGGKVFLGANPSTPEVGDTRVSFQVIKPGPRSVVAQQVGNSFQAYPTKAGDEIVLVAEGVQNAAAMFKTAQDQNRTLTWILRAVGFFLMFIGLLMVFKPISVFADVIPLVGTVLGAGLGVFAFLTAAILSLTTIAVSWIVVRPVLGVGLLVVAGGVAAWLISIGVKKKKARAALAPVPAPA
jgi:Transmembrane protein 43